MAENKSFIPHSHIPYGQDGSGFYSDNNLACFNVNQAAIPLFVEAAQSVDIKNGSVFTIVDYGAADGGTSMPLMYACVKAIRDKYGEEQPINVIYEDQPVNDFKSLFMRLQGLIPGPRSLLLDFPNVYVMANGTSFYSQCLPRDSVTLGYSATAIHWLSEKPCDITNTFFVHQPNTVPKEKEKYSGQAARDWELFLLHRAAELMPGGRMVISSQAVDKDGHFVAEQLIHFINNYWKEFADEGIISKDEFKATGFTLYFRTLDELRKPFECRNSSVSQAGLQLVSEEIRRIPCPFREKWMKEKGDPKEYAKRFVAPARVWGNSTFISGLSSSRSEEEKTQIVEELYGRYEAEVAEHPENHSNDYIGAYLVIQKRLGQ